MFALEKLSSAECRQLCKQSLKGTFVNGVIDDKGIASLYDVHLDFQGRDLPDEDSSLLSGYAVEGTDNWGRTHVGSLQVLSAYAWVGGDAHEWAAHFSTPYALRDVILRKDGKKIASFAISIKHEASSKLGSFSFEKGVLSWLTPYGDSELLLSTDRGKSWKYEPRLGPPTSSVPLYSILGEYCGDVLILFQGYEKGTVYLRCMKVTTDLRKAD